jgi:hypothetical protein
MIFLFEIRPFSSLSAQVEFSPTNSAQSYDREEMPTSAEDSQVGEEALKVVIWNPEVQDSKLKRTKRRYGKTEGGKVAANRGYACDDHRRKKVKVNLEILSCLHRLTTASVTLISAPRIVKTPICRRRLPHQIP